MKKMLTTSLATLAVAGLISGGTFATWSTFEVIQDNESAAGELVLNADTTSMTTNGGGGPLAPGENKTTWKYVANRSDNTVALEDALLSITIAVTDDLDNGCAGNGEAVAEGVSVQDASDGNYTDAACDADDGELDEEAYLQIRKSAVSTTIDDVTDCASASTSSVGGAKTLRGWETFGPVSLGTLDPNEGLCIGFEYGLKGAGIAPPGIDFGTEATNASQGDSAVWDARLDLVQE